MFEEFVEEMKKRGIEYIHNDYAKEEQEYKEEIERLNKELEVAKTNEETYRLEMLDITKRLGLDEETLFDDVKDKAERLHSIIKEVREYIKQTGQYLEDIKRFKVNVLEPNYLDILEILDKENI